MKLTRFEYNGSEHFGFVKNGRFHAFEGFPLAPGGAAGEPALSPFEVGSQHSEASRDLGPPSP